MDIEILSMEIAKIENFIHEYEVNELIMEEIVHFVETFYGNGQEDLLVQSVKRKPTIHTIWMLHRLINDPKGTRNNEFVSLMKEVADRTDIDKVIVNSAKAFLIGQIPVYRDVKQSEKSGEEAKI